MHCLFHIALFYRINPLQKNKFLKMKHAKDETIIEYKIKRMKNIRISPFTGTKRVTEMFE